MGGSDDDSETEMYDLKREMANLKLVKLKPTTLVQIISIAEPPALATSMIAALLKPIPPTASPLPPKLPTAIPKKGDTKFGILDTIAITRE
jgi:hypothetical protein